MFVEASTNTLIGVSQVQRDTSGMYFGLADAVTGSTLTALTCSAYININAARII
jgi:hypothetical protein